MECSSVGTVKRVHSKITAPGLWRADFGPFFGICLVQSHGLRSWREEGPGKLLNIQGSPPPGSGVVHPKRGSQAKTPAGLHGGVPGQTQTLKGSPQRGRRKDRKPGRDAEKLSEQPGGSGQESWSPDRIKSHQGHQLLLYCCSEISCFWISEQSHINGISPPHFYMYYKARYSGQIQHTEK